MADIRPTRRGLAVVGLAVAGGGAALGFGPRALDALVAGSAVALVAAVLQLRTLDPPAVTRTPPPGGTPDTTAEMRLHIETSTPFTGVVTDTLPPALDGDPRTTRLVGEGAVTYDVVYRERGEHAVGPVEIAARDVLGLAERRFVDPSRSAVVVFPRVYRPPPAVADRLRGLSVRAQGGERGAFDHLREYTQGDSLQDVHWKSSAKREDLVVREFADDSDRATIGVRASAAAGHADAMAEAAATVCCALLDDGAGVALATPDGRVRVGPDGVERLLTHLARTGDGAPTTTGDTDVIVRADADGTTVTVDGETTRIDPGERRAVATSPASETSEASDPAHRDVRTARGST
jgi:uncharacterized protein (DUF58 family)